ncbi:MAG: zinc ribbon domain-containing protein [Candidatus Hodarchaeales archaeon]|jgi:hypothetical protein
MEKNQKDSLLTLLGGSIGILVLIAIFTDWIEFTDAILIGGAIIAVIIAVSMYLESGSDKNLQMGFIGLMIGAGVEIILMGLFSDIINFETAIIIAVVIFVLSGAGVTYIGTDESNLWKKRVRYHPVKQVNPSPIREQQRPVYNSSVPVKGIQITSYCRECGVPLEKDSSFCSNCGTSVE